MKVIASEIPDVLILEPEVFTDARGFFLEGYNQLEFSRATGLNVNFVQDNHSRSSKGVLRGLHYQVQQTQGKLLSVACGSVFTVAVDIRRSSDTFARWVGVELSDTHHRQLWVPAGFAHGFFVLSDSADVLYKTTAYYAPQFERCIAWDDASLAIQWPMNGKSPVLSAKDAAGKSLLDSELL